MLYDILPPLVLFLSLGGIIVLISRVVVRVRRQQVAREIQAAAASRAPVRPDRLFRPGQRGVFLLRNRAALLSQAVREVAGWPKAVGAYLKRARVQRPTRAAQRTPTASWPAQRIVKPAAKWWDALRRVRTAGEQRLSSAGATLVKRVSRAGGGTPEQKPKRVQTQLVEHTQAPPASSSHVHQTLVKRLLAKERASSPVEQAEAALRSAQYRRVEQILVPHLAQHPRDVTGYMLLGKAALGRKAWDEAVEIFEQVVHLHEREPGAYANLGHAAFYAGYLTRCLEALQRAHDSEPDNRQVLELLLTLAQRMDNKVLRQSVLEKLTALEPKNEEYVQELRAIKIQEKTPVV